jgi:hypothetical protein
MSPEFRYIPLGKGGGENVRKKRYGVKTLARAGAIGDELKIADEIENDASVIRCTVDCVAKILRLINELEDDFRRIGVIDEFENSRYRGITPRQRDKLNC